MVQKTKDSNRETPGMPWTQQQNPTLTSRTALPTLVQPLWDEKVKPNNTEPRSLNDLKLSTLKP